MIWKDEYLIGIAEIDEQHKTLFLLAEKIKKDIKEDCENDKIISNSLIKIVQYTKQHFSTEERIMEELSYPGLANQKIEHRDLVKELKIILMKLKKGNKYSGIQLYNLVNQWLVNHILTEDIKIRDFVKTQR